MSDNLKIKFTFSHKRKDHNVEWPWTDYMTLAYVLNNPIEAKQFNSGPYEFKFKEPCSVTVDLSEKGKLDFIEVEESVRDQLAFLQKFDYKIFDKKSYPNLLDNINFSKLDVYAEQHNKHIYIVYEKYLSQDLDRIVHASEDVGGMGALATTSVPMTKTTLSSPRGVSTVSSATEDAGGTAALAGKSSMNAPRVAIAPLSPGEADHSWRLDRTCKVVVTQKTVEESGATFILDMFETYRKSPELKTSFNKDVTTVQFPLPYHRSPNCNENLCFSFHRLMDEFKPRTIVVDLGKMEQKSWPILDFVEAVISCLQSCTQKLKSADGDGERLDMYFCSTSPVTFESICRRLDKVVNQAAPDLQASVLAASGGRKKAVITIEVKFGSLETERADALVCSMRSDLNLRKAGASAALLKVAGDQLQDELNTKYLSSDELYLGEIAVVHGHRLNCQYVLLGVMNKYELKYDRRDEGPTKYFTSTVYNFMRQCLEKADELGLRSLAFSAVGCGNLMFPVDIVAKEMFQAIRKYELNCPASGIIHVSFVIFHQDEQGFQVFIDEQKKFSSTRKMDDVCDAKTDPDFMRSRGKHQKGDVDDPMKHRLEELSPDVAGATSKRIKTDHRAAPDTKLPRADKPGPRLKLGLPPNISRDATEFFTSKLLSKYSKYGLKFTFGSDNLEYDGPEEYIISFKTEFTSERNRLATEVSNATLDVSSRDGEMDVFGKEFEDKGVFVEYDKQTKEVKFYGKKWDVIQKVLQIYKSRLSGAVTRTRGNRQFAPSGGSDVMTGGATGGPSDGGARKKTGAAGTAGRQPFSWSSKTSYLDVYTMKTASHEVTIKVYSANILDVPVDCIVNAANAHLNHGGGVAKFIAKAAGKRLVAEGDRYVKQNGALKVGEACYTTAGKLSYGYVIHTVGPCWSWYKPHTLSNVHECERDLEMAIKNALSTAEKCGCSTIGIPAVSAGKFGCPAELCAFQYAKAVLRYIGSSRHPLQEIHFIDMSIPMVKQIQQVFKKVAKKGGVLSYTDYDSQMFVVNQKTSNVVAAGKADKKGSQSAVSGSDKDRFVTTYDDSYGSQYPYCLPEAALPDRNQIFTCFFSQNHKLMVYKGDILSLENIDIIACGENVKGDAGGYLANQLHLRGKTSYQDAKKKAFKHPGKGDVIVCSAGENRFKAVAHAILYLKKDAKDDAERRKNVHSVYSKLFEAMVKGKCHSLAMPLLGSGKGHGDPIFYTERLFESIYKFSKAHSSTPLQVHLVNIEAGKTDNAITTIQQQVRSVRPKPPAQGHRQAPARPKSAAPAVTKSVKVGRGRAGDQVAHRPSTARVHRHGAASSGARNMYSARDTDDSASDDDDNDIGKSSGSHSKGATGAGMGNYTSTARAQTSNPAKPQKGNLNVIELDDDDDDAGDDGNAISEDVEHMSLSERDTAEEHREDDPYSDASDPGDLDKPDDQSDLDDCVICMDKVTGPKKLPCGHTFCTDCIEAQFAYKQACPTCGAVCGIITGDQPEGRMEVHISQSTSCVGYEKYGRIQVTYNFHSGLQKINRAKLMSNHPDPGKPYKGIKRSGYLPDNRRGREVLEMLKVAFERKLVFTIGNSRTTGQQGVITWNDIHHKTDPQPHTPFGYPDPTYIDRVVDELKAKGVTPADIPKQRPGHSTHL